MADSSFFAATRPSFQRTGKGSVSRVVSRLFSRSALCVLMATIAVLGSVGCDRAAAPGSSAARPESGQPRTADASARGPQAERAAGGGAPVASGAVAGTGAANAARTFNSTDVTGADYGKRLELVDGSGKLRTLDDFRGKAVLLFFGFTSCPDVCPTALMRAVEIRKALGADADRLQVLFASVDYERDTPEVVGRYASAFDPSFVGLTGDRIQVARAAHDFKVFYQRVPSKDGQSYTMDHTAASYVLDPKGQLRLYVRGAQSAQDVASDIRRLL